MKLAPGRIVSRLLTGVSLLLTAATFFLFVVMTAPQESERAILADQPLTAAAPAVQIAGDAQLHTLLEGFPVPVLCSLPGHGLTLVSGASSDVPFEDGVARHATLTYVKYAKVAKTVDTTSNTAQRAKSNAFFVVFI